MTKLSLKFVLLSFLFIAFFTNIFAQSNGDDKMKIRLGFTSVKNIHRQLLVTADTNATSGIGFCYNANSFENHPYNMYWTISDRLFLIQGIDIINEYSILALGLDISTAAVSTK